MAKVLVLYHSVHGHIALMAAAVLEGAQRVSGTRAVMRRVPETMTEEAFRQVGGVINPNISIASPEELPAFDAIIFGTPTRFGNMSAQMRSFLDQTGILWMTGALVGKIGSVFTSSATQHGGQESTLLTFHPTLLHHGMIVVGLPYSEKRQMGLDEIKGGSPYGASTITGGQGERMPSSQELAMASYQGEHVASIAARLSV